MRHAPNTHLHREVYIRTPRQIDREIRKRRGDYDVAMGTVLGLVVTAIFVGIMWAAGAL